MYCDFKPENVMVEEETVKLIDLGAVRRIDDTGGDIYGSKGYSAPEATTAPTPVSDLYTVGRALAVLVASFDFQGKHEHSLPPPSECAVFQQHEALYRFLLKATRPKEEERFQTAAEMAEQLVGVLRRHRRRDRRARPRRERDLRRRLGRRRRDHGGGPQRGRGHPRLKVDKEDQAAGLLVAAGAVTDPEKRIALFARGLKQTPSSVELRLRWVDRAGLARQVRRGREAAGRGAGGAPDGLAARHGTAGARGSRKADAGDAGGVRVDPERAAR